MYVILNLLSENIREKFMKVSKDKMVSIHYTLTDKEGEILDASTEDSPLQYLHGRGYIIPGLENRLEGTSVGDKLSVDIPAMEAYGEYNQEAVFSLPKENFPEGMDIQVGMHFEFQGEYGPGIVVVTAVSGDSITVDANHPLAGKDLHFEVEVKDVRDATDTELSSFAGDSCGCGCSGGDCGSGCSSGGCCGCN